MIQNEVYIYVESEWELETIYFTRASPESVIDFVKNKHFLAEQQNIKIKF